MPRKKVADAEKPKSFYDGTETVLRKNVDVFDEQYLMTMRQIAFAFNVTVDSVSKWPVKPIVKKGKSVYYYLPEVVNFRQGGDDTPKINPAQAKARLDDARRESVELDLAKKRGDLVSMDQVVKGLEQQYMVVRQRLLALPNKLARLVAPEAPQVAHEIMYKGICDALRDLSYELINQKSEDEPTGQAQTSTGGEDSTSAPEDDTG